MDNFDIALQEQPKKELLEGIQQQTIFLNGVISGMCNRTPEVTNAYIGYHENAEGDTESIVAVTFQHEDDVYTVSSFISGMENEEEQAQVQYAVSESMTNITKNIADEFTSRDLPLPSGIAISIIQGTSHFNLMYSSEYENPEVIVTDWIHQMQSNSPSTGSVFAPGALQIMFPAIDLGEDPYDQ